MSSYGQWVIARTKRAPSRLTWVCGESRILVNEVIGATANDIGADDTEQWRAGKDSERDIWSAVLSISVAGYKRLTVIRDAGRLKDWRQLSCWLDARAQLVGSYVLFVAEEHDFPKDEDGKLAPPTDMLRDSTLGQIIRCSPLSPEDAVAWVIRQFPVISEGPARHLLFRTSGDLGEVKSVLSKAGFFGGSITDEALDLLCAELPGDFADRLIMKDLPGSMLAADTMDAAGLGYSLGYLTSRLQLLSVLHRAGLENVSRRDVISKLGVPAFLAQKYARVAIAEYHADRVRRAWQALSTAEDAHKSRVSAGVAEVLVTSWWG